MPRKKEDTMKEEILEKKDAVSEENIGEPENPAPETDELKQLGDKYLRLLAEYENYRKRSTKEREVLFSNVTAMCAKNFLPLYDNLERAVKNEPENRGVELIFNQCGEIFESLNIKEIPAAGEKFDPKLHEAVMHVEDEAYGENEVVEVFEKGFIIGEHVLRHTMVKVAN